MKSLIIFAARDLVFVIALLSGLVFLRATAKQKQLLLVSAGLALLIGFALVLIAGAIHYHARPFVLYNIAPLVAHGNDNGFPSEHTFIAMLMAFLIAQVSWRWGLGLFGLALAVGIGRVAALVHWPIDIVGGTIIAALAVAGAHFAAAYILKLIAKPKS
jgi:undecaprenyl-diphosphatase